MRDSPELHWSTQAGTSSSVRDPYPACGLIFHRRPLSGLPPHFRRERRIKRWGLRQVPPQVPRLAPKQRQSGTEMPKFCLGNYAFFGVGEPAACGAGVVTVPFAVVACCNAFPRPQRDDAERGGRNTARRRYAALVRCMRLAVVLCYNFVSNSAWLYPLTPLVIMPRKSSREKSESRNTSSGFIPSCLPIS